MHLCKASFAVTTSQILMSLWKACYGSQFEVWPASRLGQDLGIPVSGVFRLWRPDETKGSVVNQELSESLYDSNLFSDFS